MKSQQSVLEQKLVNLIDQKFKDIYNNLGDGEQLLLSLDFRNPPKNEQVIQFDRTSGQFVFSDKFRSVQINNTHNSYTITDASGANIVISEATYYTSGLMTADDKQRLDNSAILTDSNDWVAPQTFSSITASLFKTSARTLVSSSSVTIDVSTSNIFELYLTSDINHLNIINPPTANNTVFSFTLKINQQNDNTIAWPINIVWPNSIPYNDFNDGSVVIFEFTTYDRGNLWYCQKVFDSASLVFGFNDNSIMLSKNNEVFQLRH